MYVNSKYNGPYFFLWLNIEHSLSQKQFTYWMIYTLVKSLEFLVKIVRLNLCNFHTVHTATVTHYTVEKQEILSHWKNISWNQLFGKTVDFTKFLSKTAAVWKLRKFTLTHFLQKFRVNNSFITKITKYIHSWLDEIFFRLE